MPRKREPEEGELGLSEEAGVVGTGCELPSEKG